MPLNTQHQTVHVKEEATFGADVTPAAADARAFLSFKRTESAQSIDRPLVNGTGVPGLPVVGARKATAAAEMDLRGSGTAGTAPEVGLLLEICGFKHTNNAGVSDTYDASVAVRKSATAYDYIDGKLYPILGMAGSCKLDLPIGGGGKFTFNFGGAYVEPTDVALVDGTGYESTLPKACLGIAASWGTVATPQIMSLSVDFGQKVVDVPDMNNANGLIGCMVASLAPVITVKIVEPLKATANWHSFWTLGTSGAFAATIGGTAGNKVDIVVAAANVKSCAHGGDGLAELDVVLACADFQLKFY
jgi:hypothetical protein